MFTAISQFMAGKTLAALASMHILLHIFVHLYVNIIST